MTSLNDARAINEATLKWQDSHGKPGLIYSKIIKVMSELGAISKSRKNQAQNFMFRGIDDVYNALHPLFAEHGIFTVPEVINRQYTESTSKSGTAMIERILTVRYRFYAEDGSYVEAVVDGEAMDSGDKSSNKCMAIAHKYALLQVFCIPTEGDNDPDAHTPEARDPEKPRRRATTIKPEPAREPARATVAHKPSEPELQDDIAATTHGSLDEAKRQKILARALEVLEPLVPGSPRYLWAMQEIFRSQDWAVIKGYSLNKLDADTRGRIAQIVEQALDTSEESCAKLLAEDLPIEDRIEGAMRAKIKSQMDEEDRERATKSKAALIASLRKHIEQIPEGPAREDAMNKAFGKADWAELDAFSLKEVEEVVEGGRITRIVKDALEAAK